MFKSPLALVVAMINNPIEIEVTDPNREGPNETIWRNFSRPLLRRRIQLGRGSGFPGPGVVLSRETNPYHRRLEHRRRLRPRRASARQGYGQVYSRQPRSSRPKYARRRLGD